MSRASREGADGRKGSKERVCEGARVRGRKTAKVRATDSPWFIGVGENLVVRK